ncbi:MAG: hypothetical protein ACYCR7_03120 [Thermoplasmataceae archaeon]
MKILKSESARKQILMDEIITIDEERISLMSVVENCSYSIRHYIDYLAEREMRLIGRFKKKFGIYPPAGNDLVWLEYISLENKGLSAGSRNKI